MATIIEYTYMPLDSFSQSIRLVALQPSSGSNTIECKLHTVALTDCPSYIALSYTWGSPENLVSIHIDGKELFVRENLWSFLATMLHDRRWRLFWIDAICIDQSNSSERNHQVNMMRQIYAQAHLVVVWLGPAEDFSDLAVEYITNGNISPPDPQLNLKCALRSLLKRLYWTRVWIVQELMLARDIIFFCGQKSFTWGQIASFRQRLKMGSHLGGDTTGCFSSAVTRGPGWFIIAQKTIWAHCNNHMPLSTLLVTYKNQESTDARDQVYGLLGLATENPVKVDYDISVEDLYIKVLQAISMDHKSSYSFSAIEYTLQRTLLGLDRRLGDLPTLVSPLDFRKTLDHGLGRKIDVFAKGEKGESSGN